MSQMRDLSPQSYGYDPYGAYTQIPNLAYGNDPYTAAYGYDRYTDAAYGFALYAAPSGNNSYAMAGSRTPTPPTAVGGTSDSGASTPTLLPLLP
jgi:hypothetical protein